LVEKIEELLEDRLQASGLLKTNAHSNRNEPANGDFLLEQGFAVVHSTQPEPLENVIRKLDNDFYILRDELVNLANTGSLELQTVQLHVETEALKAQTTRVSDSVSSYSYHTTSIGLPYTASVEPVTTAGETG
jgi:hypothetical protein